MSYAKLDNEEILKVALSAINQDNHVEAISLLKTLIERDDKHAFANYLLAAEHAQIGMLDRAEIGFSKVVSLAPDFKIARFQLGQLYMLKGDAELVRKTLMPLVSNVGSNLELSHFAKGLIAIVDENITNAITELKAGLDCEQENPTLAGDMARILENLSNIVSSDLSSSTSVITPQPSSNIYLSGYSKTK